MNTSPVYRVSKSHATTVNVAIPAQLKPAGKFAEHIAVLAHTLFLLTVCVEERRKGYWIPFSSSSWRSLFGSNYLQVKQEAKRLGFEFNESYSTDIGFCKSMRLPEPLRTSGLQMFTLTKPNLIKRLMKWRRNSEFPSSDSAQYLVESFMKFRLDLSPSVLRKFDLSVQLNVTAIQEENYFARRCRFGRFHSLFSVLPKEIRRMITTVEGQSTVEIDVSNCQPLLVGLLVKQGGASDRDSGLFLKVCSKGKLYEFLQSRIEPEVYVDDFGKERKRRKTRKYVKELFFRMLFGTALQTIRNPCFVVVQRFFPSVAEWTLEQKAEGHQRVAHLCQRLESKIVIDTVVPKLKNQQIPVITIHDSIICSRKQSALVTKNIAQAFEEQGLIPALTCNR